jgi:hypothetical protein
MDASCAHEAGTAGGVGFALGVGLAVEGAGLGLVGVPLGGAVGLALQPTATAAAMTSAIAARDGKEVVRIVDRLSRLQCAAGGGRGTGPHGPCRTGLDRGV